MHNKNSVHFIILLLYNIENKLLRIAKKDVFKSLVSEIFDQ